MDKSPEAFRTISEVADEIDVPQHVLRFWESRFAQIRPMKRGGGRRFYRPEDIDLLRGVRHLLYGEGYTVRGVQRILREQGVTFVQDVWHKDAELPTPANRDEIGEAAQAEHAESDLSLISFGSRAHVRAGEGWAQDRHRPPAATAPPPVPSAVRGIAVDAKRKLRAALDDLVECHRLIEAALEDCEPGNPIG